jgi:hypothetical protein
MFLATDFAVCPEEATLWQKADWQVLALDLDNRPFGPLKVRICRNSGCRAFGRP